MQRELFSRADRYFRNPKTRLARSICALSPQTGETYRNSSGKQMFEKTLATAGEIITFPLQLGIAAAIKLEDGGPVYYKQERVGKNGKPFIMTKFRTMQEGADQDSAANINNALTPGISKDPRSTRIGEFLRRTRLDELPQLGDIRNGNMALFGVRADNETTFRVMKEERPEDFDDYRAVYEAALPAAINPMTAFTTSSSPDARYHYTMFEGRNASLGVDLYKAFRTLTRLSMRPHTSNVAK